MLPTSKSTRINVLGFLSIDMNFQSYIFKCSVNTDVVEASFNNFSEIITRKTVVIVDNAPTHTSIQFTDNLVITPPAEREASGSPPEGGYYIRKAPLGLIKFYSKSSSICRFSIFS